MTRVLVFDLDDTLYPEWQFVESGFRAVHAWQMERGGDARFFEQAWQIFKTSPQELVFDRTLEALTGSVDRELVEEMVRVYRGHAPALTLHEDAAWALDHCKGRAVLGLLTNGRLSAQQSKVRALRLDRWIEGEHVLYCGAFDRRHWKPAPFCFERIMEKLGGAGADYTYVGDNPHNDFIAPRALGWRTIHVERSGGFHTGTTVPDTHRAERQIASLRELEHLL